MNDDLCALPIQILQREATDLRGTQAESDQQHQNRVITLADPGRAVAASQQAFDLICRERFGQLRQAPMRDTGEACGQVGLDGAALQKVLKKCAQHRDGALRVRAADAPFFRQNEAMQVTRPQIMKTQCAIFESRTHQQAYCRQDPLHGG